MTINKRGKYWNNLARGSTNSKLGSFPIKETKQVRGKTDENKILSVLSMKHISPAVSKETIDLVNLKINYLPKHCSSRLKSSSPKTEPDGARRHPTLHLTGSSLFAINPAFLCVLGFMFRWKGRLKHRFGAKSFITSHVSYNCSVSTLS